MFMNMDWYQSQALTTFNHDLSPELTISVLALGLTGEAGEVADLIKKKVGHGHQIDTDELEKELGDVLWYIAALAHTFDLTLVEIAERNLAKLRKRYPNGFSSEASQNRQYQEV